MSTVNLTVVHPSQVSDRGVLVPDWSDTELTEEAGWFVHPLSSAELSDMGRQGTDSLYRAIGPASSALVAGDRATVGDVTYEVDGRPLLWPSKTGALDHMEAVLRLVEG